RLLERGALRPDPQPASRQPPREVGDDLAGRPDDEADHPLGRTGLAGDDAGAHRPGNGSRGFGLAHGKRLSQTIVPPVQAFAASPAAASSTGNQCSRAFMMMALAVSVSIALSPTISRSSSEARSPRSSSDFTPLSPSATSIGRLRPSTERTSSLTPS